MSETHRSVARVRQLSLQSSTPRRWQIRRQKTSDDEKSPKIHGDPIGSGRNRANSRSGSLRPKVRIAWGERHRENDSIDHVEVVARQITGKSKSALKKSQNRNMIVNEEKSSILYSRQELTERLRLAWKHREENKANIDIFLAHGVVEERCDSESSNYTTISEPQTPISESIILQSTKDRHVITDRNNTDISRNDNTYEIQITKRADSFESRTDLNKDIKETTRPKKTKMIEDNSKVVGTSSVKLQNDASYSGPIERIKYVENNTNKTLEGTIEVPADQSVENEKEVCIQKDDNIKLPTLKSETTTLNGPQKTQNEASSAKQKRANFQSGTNRAFLYTETDKTAVLRVSNDTDIPSKLSSIERSSSCKRTMEIKQNEAKSGPQNAIKSINDQKPNRKSRSSSAPLQGRSSSRIQVNVVIDTTCDSGKVQKGSNDISDKGKVNEEEVFTDKKKEILSKPSYARPIRSAPIKKRLKNIKKRQHSVGSACKDEQCNGSRGRCRISTKDCDGKSNDVITMVSLVSSTESDSDLENSPNEAKLISQLREKLTTAPIIKTSTTPIPGNIRKPMKSVSFQRDSFDEDTTLEKAQFGCVKTKNSLSQNRFIVIKDSEDLEEYGTSKDSILWKSSEIKTALPMLSFVQDESESLCVPLMEHDMRSLAVPIGNMDDMKKKPHRIRNTSTLAVLDKKTTMIEMRKDNETIATDDQLATRRTTMAAKFLLPKVNPNTEISLKEKNTDAIPIEMEPQLQTRKEKDCWHLYKRMCDKGVNVSFDTVLRGMLTPTEYRLRQKEYLQNF